MYRTWIPAFAGMIGRVCLNGSRYNLLAMWRVAGVTFALIRRYSERAVAVFFQRETAPEPVTGGGGRGQ